MEQIRAKSFNESVEHDPNLLEDLASGAVLRGSQGKILVSEDPDKSLYSNESAKHDF